MTPEQKKAAERLRVQGQSVAGIANSLGISSNTIKTFLRREQKKKEYCRHCRRALVQVPGRKLRTFCSDACRYAWWKGHRDLMNHKVIYHYICFYCGKVFDSCTKGRKYCGHLCYIAARFGVP